jgi:peptide/nickel transport system permease protein
MADTQVQQPAVNRPSAATLPRESLRERLKHSPVYDVVRRLARNKLAVVGFVIIGTVILVAILAPVLAQQHPSEAGIFSVNPRENKQPPSLDHPMGTDAVGRDLMSMIIYGARISIRIGVFAVGLAIIVGSILGAIAGFAGGLVDTIIMRIMDIMLAFPSILLALAIVVVIGPGLFNAMVAVGIVAIPTYARITRASVLSENEKDYVMAAQALGVRSRRILARHIVPNILSPIIVTASLGIATAILDAAGLGFLGLGAQPPTPEWGLLLSRNQKYMFTSPWMVFFPGISIMFLVLGFNLLGDGLRDALDPRLRHQ